MLNLITQTEMRSILKWQFYTREYWMRQAGLAFLSLAFKQLCQGKLSAEILSFDFSSMGNLYLNMKNINM